MYKKSDEAKLARAYLLQLQLATHRHRLVSGLLAESLQDELQLAIPTFRDEPHR